MADENANHYSERDDERVLMALALQHDHFQVLRITPDATRQQVDAAYLLLDARFSPRGDESSTEKAALEAVRTRLKLAYEMLKDPDRRAEFREIHLEEKRRARQVAAARAASKRSAAERALTGRTSTGTTHSGPTA